MTPVLALYRVDVYTCCAISFLPITNTVILKAQLGCGTVMSIIVFFACKAEIPKEYSSKDCIVAVLQVCLV